MPLHRYAVWASGRGSNFKAMLGACRDGRLPYKPALLLTDTAAAPVLDIAREAGVDTLFIDPKVYKGRTLFGEKAVAELKARGIDTIVLAGFMRIIDGGVVRAFPNRIINIHPALLPRFPGLDAQQQAITAGVTQSGCTVHFVDEGIDTGPIIMQAQVPVPPGDTAETLAARILVEEHRIYPLVVRALMEDRIALVDGRGTITDFPAP